MEIVFARAPYYSPEVEIRENGNATLETAGTPQNSQDTGRRCRRDSY